MVAEADATEQAADEDETDEDGALFDILDVIEGISAHFHEHHDAIMAWSWPLFCAKWARMVKQTSKREAERKTKERERERDKNLQELHQALRW